MRIRNRKGAVGHLPKEISSRRGRSASRSIASKKYAASKVSIAVAAALAVSPPRAFATEPADSTDLGEIVVTARKRAENLQDVPLSIDVFTKKDMQNLGITGFDDFATKTPSISFISTGPGTQLFVMRGVSDGSNPNYANTSATGFFLDDMSLSASGVQPDLHLYDIERIEVLNGPQGTTYGASSMSGAIRYITNKPDVNAFSAGFDFDGGHIQGGQQNWTYEGFFNAPLIDGVLGLRLSAFSDSHGGFIDNAFATRTWINGTVSNNAPWAGSDYNREHVEGGRVALRGVINDGWSASLTYSYQRQETRGAWDEDPTLAPRTVERFGPEGHLNEAKMLDFRLDGDVGIGDLVFASTYWSLPTRQQNEYSQYIQNFGGYFGVPGANEGWTCTNDPVYGTGPYANCKVPIQYFEYHTNPQRWSNELRLSSKPGGRFHWLGGLYWEKTVDKNSGSTYYMPGLRTNSPAFEYYNNLNGAAPGSTSLPPGIIYAYTERSDYLQTTEFANISFDITNKLNVEAGESHFHSSFVYADPFGQFAYAPTTPSLTVGSSHKWDSKFGLNYKLLDHVMVYADFGQGFRDGGSNSGYPQSCYEKGVPQSYVPDTLNNYELGWKTTLLDNHLTWDGATYLIHWKQLQTIIYDATICAPSSFNANVGNARIYGLESNVDYKITDNWSMQASGGYTDSHLVSTQYATFEGNVGERLPFVPYFSWSANVRYEHPLVVVQDLKGYAQIDFAHKGDMWNDLHVTGSNGLPRILQPPYTVANLRLGVNPLGGHWLTEFYVTNLFDKNAIVFSNTGNYDLRETTNEPRVFGLRLNYRFGKETNAE
jgi:outer membrane receptor protein involved in Fe transport